LILGTAKRFMRFMRRDIKLQQFNQALVESRSRTEMLEMMQCPYSREVTKRLPQTKEIKKIFSDNELIWMLVEESRYDLTPRSIRRIVETQILKRAHDRDYEKHEFYQKICGKSTFMAKKGKGRKRKTQHGQWKQVKYAAKLWFQAILEDTRDSIHLSHTKLFPFSAKTIESVIESDLNEQAQNESGTDYNFDNFGEKEMETYLRLMFVTKDEDQQLVIESIRSFGDDDAKFMAKKNNSPNLWDRFLHFAYTVRRLFGRVRNIENMIRDVEDAGSAHGQDQYIYVSHFQLVFEDIQNDAVAMVVFRSIDQEAEKIPYFKVRFFLIALKQMRRNVDRELLEKSRYSQVSKSGFLDIVLRRVKARDDDSDDDDLSDDDNMRNDTEQAKEEIKGIRKEGEAIFDRIWKHNDKKVTLTQIRQYMRKVPKEMLNPDLMVFIRDRLKTYKKSRELGDDPSAAPPLTSKLFEEIVRVDPAEYGVNRKQEADETVKWTLWDENDNPLTDSTDLNAVLERLREIFDGSEDTDDSQRELTVIDGYNLLRLAVEMRGRIRNEIKSRGHDLELTQDNFVKTMEKAMYSKEVLDVTKADYSRPYREWSEVARRSASVFQQVQDEEQNKVTLGQVRETLLFLHEDIRLLTKNISKFKKKLDKLKKTDQMVDHQRFWTFLVREMNVEDDEAKWYSRNEEIESAAALREDSESSTTVDLRNIGRTVTVDSFEDPLHSTEPNHKSGASKGKRSRGGDLKNRKTLFFERSKRVFNAMESQNGLWITMRQIHVYLLWLTEKLQSVDMDWLQYQSGDLGEQRVDERTFKTVVLTAMSSGETVRKSVLDVDVDHEKVSTEFNLARTFAEDPNGFEFQQSGDENEEKYSTQIEQLRSRKELDRLRKKIWSEGDDKLFSSQLSWIFRQCAISDVATDELSSWRNICSFIRVFRDGSIEERIRHDLKFLGGNHQVYRDEFEQFKATLKCRGETAKSLFYQIRQFNESINWSQIVEFLDFIELNMVNVEDAIDKEDMGEDEDPSLEELIAFMNIQSQVDGHWLFSMVLNRHSETVSWVEIREFLKDWIENRDEVTDYFEELLEKRYREQLTEKALDEIDGKLSKIKKYFDGWTNASRDELSKLSKEDLIEHFTSAQIRWHNASKGRGHLTDNTSALPVMHLGASKNNSSIHRMSSLVPGSGKR